MKEIVEPYYLKRSASRLLGTERSEINISRHNSSYLRLSGGAVTDRTYQSVQPINRIKLKPISKDELNNILATHKQNTNKEGNVGVVILKPNSSEYKQKTEVHKQQEKETQQTENINEKSVKFDESPNQLKAEETTQQITEQKPVQQKDTENGLFVTQD